MKVSLERINEDYLFEVTNSKGMSINLDNNSKTNGEVKGISPMELLLMGVAGCSSIDIVSILNKQKINPKVLKMEVKGHRHEGQIPALFYQIDINIFLEGDFSPEKAKRAAQLSFDKYCSVSKTLEATAKINHKIFFNGKNIAQVMKMSVSEACEFFEAQPKIQTTLALLRDTGLGYLSLGQPSTTLSGGEAQRIKLVAEIRKGQGRARNAKIKGAVGPCANLYLIEEPTIGLHHNDVVNLIRVLHALVDEGHTVIVIEHNTSIMAEADYILDIGPEAGEGGGQIVSKGRPEQVVRSKKSRTSPFLRKIINS